MILEIQMSWYCLAVSLIDKKKCEMSRMMSEVGGAERLSGPDNIKVSGHGCKPNR